MREIIRLKNVVKMNEGNRRILGGVNLRVDEQERVCVCGPPGSGKQALMRLIAGMERPSAGEIYVLGQAVHEMDADRAAAIRSRNIGVVHRRAGFMQRLSVLENIALALTIQGTAAAKRKREAKELLGSFGIAHITHALPAQLTAYETLLVSVARSLIAQPKILMLYDAAADLSQKQTEQFAGLMNAILQYGHYTILSFRTNPEDVLRVHRTVLLEHGKMTEERT